MVAILRALQPNARFNLTVSGGRAMTAEAMLAVIRHELSMRRYHLVLWQTGTVEAVGRLPPALLRETLQHGVSVAAEAKADLVLIDPLYSRFLHAKVDLAPYEAVLEQVTNGSSADLFHRQDLTQLWASKGQVDPERTPRDQREKTVGLLNRCVGHALASYILAGVPGH
jgi:hypothetical protein